MAAPPDRVRIKLDFTTPNEVFQAEERHRVKRKRAPASPTDRPTCPFCFQRGRHRSAADCLRALERQT